MESFGRKAHQAFYSKSGYQIYM